MKTEPGYEPLAAVLQEALDQAQHGKGKKCHANGKPFLEQPIMTGGRECGAGGLVFQARKKILEAMNCTDDTRAIEDCLGAINYVAALVLLRREKEENNPPMVKEAEEIKEKYDGLLGVRVIKGTTAKEVNIDTIAAYLSMVNWANKSPEVLLAVREAYLDAHKGVIEK